ncbi:amino acid oxidase [Rothia nasimurium]|uniref:amino acid oxidase n=2 Tax=Rothia nasimurium TaxID=85336 RepID=UPI001F300781|nr:amino acid oxidase [Rothia nasimurium]
MGLELSRRSLVQAGAWSTPIVLAGTAVPAYAASMSRQSGIQAGLFVSAALNGGNVGYVQSQESTGWPTTPQSYFEAKAAGTNPESDFNWDDSRERAQDLSSSWIANGEGSFTPVTNSGSGKPGAYANSSGFWFSVPTTNVGTGTDYVAGGSATLAAGAVFVTDVEFYVPQQANFLFNGNPQLNTGMQIGSRTKWNQRRTGTLSDVLNTGATYLAQAGVQSNWVADAPTVTLNPDGSGTFRGRITVTTAKPLTVTYDSKGRLYAQVVIMPSPVTIQSAYYTAQSRLQFTSYIQSGTITYSSNGVTGSRVFSNELHTTTVLRWG